MSSVVLSGLEDVTSNSVRLAARARCEERARRDGAFIFRASGFRQRACAQRTQWRCSWKVRSGTKCIRRGWYRSSANYRSDVEPLAI